MLLSIIFIVQASASGSSDNYCLLNVNDNEYGGSGVLAVPQANATQSVCESVADNTQESFDEGTDDPRRAATARSAAERDHTRESCLAGGAKLLARCPYGRYP